MANGQTESNFGASDHPGRRYWKFAVVFLAIIVVFGGGLFVWGRYFSPEAKSLRETEKSYQKYLDWEKEFERLMREDTYGGKTPEETLTMFVDALKKGDVELASKYFAYETGGPDAFNRKKWLEALSTAKQEGGLTNLTETLKQVRPVGYSDSYTWYKKSFSFESLDDKGVVKVFVELVFNHLSSVWKIESL